MSTVEPRGPKFSILLPTYNRADVLPFAIKSVLRQTVDDFELLVVGDGCTDQTAELVTIIDDPRIRWFDFPKAPNFGYANRNLALCEAKGELVAFMAHDDLWLPDHLELLGKCLEQNGAEIVYSLPLWVIPRGLIAPLIFNLNHSRTMEVFLRKAHSSIPAGCVVHRRDCLAKYGYWNEALPSCGDMDLWARILEGGKRKNFAYLPEPTCLHFRANWRKESDVGQPQLLVWKALHAFGEFMPSDLKVKVPAGMSEQEACWRALDDPTSRWSIDLRAAVHNAIEKRVVMSDDLILGLLKEDEVDRLANEDQLGSELRDHLGRLTREGDADSLAWKFVRGVHLALDWIVPPETRRGRSWLRFKQAISSRL